MLKRILFGFIITLTGCNSSQALDLVDSWQSETVVNWDDARPDMLLFSADEKSLFLTFENRPNGMSPSFGKIDMATRQGSMLIYGMDRADGLKMDQTGDLWLGEESATGQIWRITNPAQLPPEQRVDGLRHVASHPSIQSELAAGIFSHEGLAFSQDFKYLYLLDEWKGGCLYRYNIKEKTLAVFHKQQGWRRVSTPDEARLKGEVLHGKMIRRGEDMETLPNGHILFTETDTGIIWELNDSGEQPTLNHYLQFPEIEHPDNLEWDASRNWLWITDDNKPSELWAYDGKQILRVASTDDGEITGVESKSNGDLFINIQGSDFGHDRTLRLFSK
ncbi:MAG: hypothetical protein HQM07_07990 [Zetaproteobacteria bacterium]|nr:hypothetical protein [Zetaproteobacteria bacterium]